MAHDKHRDLLLFCHRQQACCALLDLTDRAGGGRDIHAPHGLDRVDDNKVRFFLFNQAADLVHIVLGRKEDVILRYFQAGRPQLHLPYRLLARDIEHTVLVGNCAAQLQKHRGLADTRLTTQKHHTAQHDAAAQHTVQLRDAGQDAAFFFGRANLGKALCRQGRNPLRAGGSRLPCRCSPGFGCFGNHILIHGIPAAAARAAPHPAGTCFPAVGTHIYCFQFWLFHEALLLFHIKHFLHCSI